MTQLTIAITGGATVFRVGYKTMLQAEQAENFVVYTPLVTFWGTLVANEVNKNLSKLCVGARRQFLRTVAKILYHNHNHHRPQPTHQDCSTTVSFNFFVICFSSVYMHDK